MRRQFIGDELAAGRATRARRPRRGGLRAGTALATGTGFRLRSVQSTCPGVAVSGFVSGDRARSVTLTVAGSAAARGKITVRPDGSVTGRLGGHRVDQRSATRAASLSTRARLDGEGPALPRPRAVSQRT